MSVICHSMCNSHGWNHLNYVTQIKCGSFFHLSNVLSNVLTKFQWALLCYEIIMGDQSGLLHILWSISYFFHYYCTNTLYIRKGATAQRQCRLSDSLHLIFLSCSFCSRNMSCCLWSPLLNTFQLHFTPWLISVFFYVHTFTILHCVIIIGFQLCTLKLQGTKPQDLRSYKKNILYLYEGHYK